MSGDERELSEAGDEEGRRRERAGNGQSPSKSRRTSLAPHNCRRLGPNETYDTTIGDARCVHTYARWRSPAAESVSGCLAREKTARCTLLRNRRRSLLFATPSGIPHNAVEIPPACVGMAIARAAATGSMPPNAPNHAGIVAVAEASGRFARRGHRRRPPRAPPTRPSPSSAPSATAGTAPPQPRDSASPPRAAPAATRCRSPPPRLF